MRQLRIPILGLGPEKDIAELPVRRERILLL
jgi:hypothetical protein